MAFQTQIYTAPPIPPKLANARTFQDLREGTKEYLSLLGKYHYDQFNTLIRGHNQNTQGLGDQIASADTIRITQPMHVITGNGTINTIIPPKGFNAMLMLFADNETQGFHLGTAGNIWVDAATPVMSYTIMCYTPKPPPRWGTPPTGPGGWWVTSNYYGGSNVTIGGRQGIHTGGPYAPTTFPVGALLYGNGAAAIQALLDVAAGRYLRSGGLLTPPRYSTLTLPDTTTIGDVLVATGNNQIDNIGPLTNGQLVIGSTGAAPVAAAPTAGEGIAIDTGAGSLTISTAPIFSQTTSVTIHTSVAETTLLGAGVGSLTLPANFFAVGRSLTITAWGFWNNTGNPTLEFKLKLGATTVFDTGANAIAPNVAGPWAWRLDAQLTGRTAGAPGSIIGQGFITYGTSHTAGALDDFAAVQTPVSITTTGTLLVDLTFQWGTSNLANTITLTNFTLKTP